MVIYEQGRLGSEGFNRDDLMRTTDKENGSAG